MTDEELLGRLKMEREKFTRANKALMESLVQQLIERCVYPKTTPMMKAKNTSHLAMVEGWGEDWHLFKGQIYCPYCEADLRDLDHGPPFKREIGWYQMDRTTHLICPDCREIIDGVRDPNIPTPTADQIERMFERRAKPLEQGVGHAQ